LSGDSDGTDRFSPRKTLEFRQNQSRQGIQAFSNNLCGSPSLSRCSADAVFLDKQTQSRRLVERPTVDSIIFLFLHIFFQQIIVLISDLENFSRAFAVSSLFRSFSSLIFLQLRLISLPQKQVKIIQTKQNVINNVLSLESANFVTGYFSF
jgi:hypothetical protein